MADLEAVLADVSYLMAMEKSKSTPAARASKKIVLPDPSSRRAQVRRCFRVGSERSRPSKRGFLRVSEIPEYAGDDVIAAIPCRISLVGSAGFAP
ncbi:hypothetical protein HPB48_020514 [Haemaphysalis longicornis]|uniref:Beta-adrenergic receptor kinase 2 n=1 Tax=Haemaphysalis longicornis TaxID=44386 RepID=A0A9J6GRT1_HAELO|nr:hypothetical protein HPB48_020514 [Haemaphysalis longicornis]